MPSCGCGPAHRSVTLADMSQICVVICSALVSTDLELNPYYDFERAGAKGYVGSPVSKFKYIVPPTFIMACSLPKVALAIIIVRAKQVRRWQGRILYSLTSSQIVLGIVAFVIDLVQCLPVEVIWNPGLFGNCSPHKLILGYKIFLGGKTHLLVTDSNA